MQIGPGIVYLSLQNWFLGRASLLHLLTPIAPLEQKMLHQIYVQRKVPTFIGKIILLSEALMVSWGAPEVPFQFPFGLGNPVVSVFLLGNSTSFSFFFGGKPLFQFHFGGGIPLVLAVFSALHLCWQCSENSFF